MEHGLCRLQDAAGRVEACPGESCPFWDSGQGACIFVPLAADVSGRPDLAQYLLELRRALDETPDAPDDAGGRTLFYRLRDRKGRRA